MCVCIDFFTTIMDSVCVMCVCIYRLIHDEYVIPLVSFNTVFYFVFSIDLMVTGLVAN